LRHSRTLALVALCSAFAGCASKPVYLNRDIVRVAVLPPWNDTSMADASDQMWPLVERNVAAKGYEVIPRETVQEYYRKLHFGTPEEIQQIKPARICEVLGVQGLVYTQIVFWGKRLEFTSGYVGVKSDFWLIDGATSEKAWAVWGEDGRNASASMTGMGALFSDPSKYAPAVVAKAFKHVPRAGFAPSENR
jgi:hypothetical protein